MFNRPTKKARKAVREVRVNSTWQLGFDYTIRYSNRCTSSIQVRNGEVRIAAPHEVPELELQRWMCDKSDWVLEKLQQQQQLRQSIPNRRYTEGEHIPFLDTTLSLQLATATDRRRKTRAQRQGNYLRITLGGSEANTAQTRVRNAVADWYRASALQLLTDKTHRRCQQMGVRATDIKLRNTRSKWGHCTPAGIIQYNWHILLAPEAVVDYLVAHECCHLVHFNHSNSFWALVEAQIPGYRQYRDWLKHNGHTLVL